MTQPRNQLWGLALVMTLAALCRGDDTVPPAVPSDAPAERLIKLAKAHDVWVDPQRKLVVVDGEVALREGALEMFACPKGSKEHESVIAVRSSAQLVHAGLLAVGAIAGHPVKFDPQYVPATGTVVDIFVLWQDERGKHKVRAQEWVKDAKTGEGMKHDWVFGGSGFWTDPATGEKYYHADGGDFICLSNFSTATLDLPIESSQANNALLFSAFTERIPPRGTKVRLVLIPRLEKKSKEKEAAEKDPSPKAASVEKAASGEEFLKDDQTKIQD